MGAVHHYNFKDGNLILIGTHRIGGWSEDGGIEYELAADTYEDVNGAYGQTTISQLNDPRMYATITVKESSKSYGILYGLWKAQKALLVKPALPFSHRDLLNGDEVSDPQCVFISPPTPSKGRTAGDREFRILLPNGVDLMVLGANNLI